jgi:UDP-N-acetyl-2-amino-2-deoxyglucuronate dehydrogenase
MATHIGLIGGGNITDTHARAVRGIAGVEIAAIYGTNANKVDGLCREHGGTPYLNFDAFLAHRPMDLVAIGSPSGLHTAQGIAAAQRGLHVLTEKPIDISTRSADDLIEATGRAGVKLGVMFQDRVKPGIRELREWISTGVVGRPLLGLLQRLAMAGDDRAGWRRRIDQSGRAYRGLATVAAGRCGSSPVAYGNSASRD